MRIFVCDTEVFKYGWLFCAKDAITGEEFVIWNDREAMVDFYTKFKDDLWVGYNIRHYDQYIIKACILGIDPYPLSQWIIVEDKPGWEYSKKAFSKVPLNFYDVQFRHDKGLKQLEGFMGMSIVESQVDFNLDRPLTQEEIDMTIKYCQYDVEATLTILDKVMNRFKAQLAICKTFKRPLRDMCKTYAQLAAKILEAKPIEYNDDYDFVLPDNLIIEKYTDVPKWFLSAKEDCYAEMKAKKAKCEVIKANLEEELANCDVEKEVEKIQKKIARIEKLIETLDWENPEDYKKFFMERQFEIEVAGVVNRFGWGGIHGAKEKILVKSNDDEILLMADVDQLYPSLMVHYNILSRAVKHPENFKPLLETSLRLKAEGKKDERVPYKEICNITYGASGADTNTLYDPLHRNLVCIYGQLFILDLLEKVEDICESLQNNTDGIFVKIKRADLEEFKRRVHEWEERTHLHMSFEEYSFCSQKDVNNYLLISKSGKFKSKGAYTKSMDELDNNMIIVREALIKYLVDGTPPEETIYNCDEMVKFQIISKIGKTFHHMVHNGKKLRERVVRVFASKSENDKSLYGYHETGSLKKIGNTPERCFINNRNIVGRKCPPKLDKEYYVKVAYERYNKYLGVKG